MRKYRSLTDKCECGCGELVASKVSNCGTKLAVQSPLSRRCLALKQRYGITYQERTAMHEQQGGCCLICNNPVEFRQAGENYTQAVIDHCHSTGEIRGILCATCNIMLGS